MIIVQVADYCFSGASGDIDDLADVADGDAVSSVAEEGTTEADKTEHLSTEAEAV